MAALLIVISILPSYAHALWDTSQPEQAILWSASPDVALTDIDAGEPDSGRTGSDARHGHHCLACACAHAALQDGATAARGLLADYVCFHLFVQAHLGSLAPWPLLRPPRA